MPDRHTENQHLRLRDQLLAVRKVAEKQNIVTGSGDQDAIGMARSELGVVVQIFFIRAGKMVGREHFLLQGSEEESDAAILKAFLQQYYHRAAFIPHEVLLPLQTPERELTQAWLEKKKGAKEAGPIYIALDQFTVNLAPDNGDQFLQVMISVEVEDMTVGDRIKSYTPKLRNNVMLLLSGKKASELSTKAGKEALANEIRDLINEILDAGAKPGYGPVKEVLFTSFIIQ